MMNDDITIQSEIIRKNTSAISRMQRQEHKRLGSLERFALLVTSFAGSVPFVMIHVVWFTAWILLNTNVLRLPFAGFDPYPFQFLTMVVSLEAIFLSTFLLIGQNHLARQSERRAELDLQVNLLAEQKAAKTLELLDGMAQQLDQMMRRFTYTPDPEVAALMVSPEPQDVLQVIEDAVTDAVADTTGEMLRNVSERVADVTDEMEAVREDVKQFRGRVEEVAEEIEEIKKEG